MFIQNFVNPNTVQGNTQRLATGAPEPMESGYNNRVTTLASGEEGGNNNIPKPKPDITTLALGEEGGTTYAMHEEGGGGIPDITTRATWEEGGDATTLALGEEGGGIPDISTLALGEEGGNTTSVTLDTQSVKTLKSLGDILGDQDGKLSKQELGSAKQLLTALKQLVGNHPTLNKLIDNSNKLTQNINNGPLGSSTPFEQISMKDLALGGYTNTADDIKTISDADIQRAANDDGDNNPATITFKANILSGGGNTPKTLEDLIRELLGGI